MNNQFGEAFSILAEAISEVFDKRWELLKALFLPVTGSTIILLSLQFVSPFSGAPWILFIGTVFFYVLFAVSCHRIILLGPGSLPSEYGIYWSMREWRFVGWLIVLFVLYFAITLPMGVVVLLLPNALLMMSSNWAHYLALIVSSYFEGRLGMVLPATAVDQRQSLGSSWELTRGRGFAVMLALIIPAVAMNLLQMATQPLLRMSPTFAEIVDSVLVYPVVAVAVGVLSVTYRRVTHQDDSFL